MGKQMGKYFRKAVVYMCLASIALYIAGCSQVLPGAVKEYIEANQSPLHLQVDGLGIPENLFSDRDLYQVYLSGESHGRKKSYTAKKAFWSIFTIKLVSVSCWQRWGGKWTSYGALPGDR